ncbi:MAG: acetyl-CoA acetyltransferase [Thaumarchaeota archaeon]|nr:acetyl-CoA acetyltransferase [Nitrososphaerota archaeon]
MKTGRVEIIGVGYEGFRPVVSDLSTRELMFQAASKAYDDASVNPRRDVGSFICCTEDLWEGWSITDEMVPDQIGAAGRPLCTIPADAVTGLGTAVMHILSGLAEVVVLEAHSKAADVLDKNAVEVMAQEPSLLRPLGATSDTLAGLEMDAFLRTSGFSLKDVNRAVVRGKASALRNPRASYGGKFSEADVESSEILSSPLRVADKAEFAEAGIVLVLASEAWAKKNKRDSVGIDGVAWNSSLPWIEGGEMSVSGYAQRSYSDAVRRAGFKGDLEDFDILELDDTYSYKLLQHLLSLAGTKAAARRILSGKRTALNPSGGSLGVGNLVEASALHRLLECALQLRGEAGSIQVKGAKKALVQSWRGIPTGTGGVAILSR